MFHLYIDRSQPLQLIKLCYEKRSIAIHQGSYHVDISFYKVKLMTYTNVRERKSISTGRAKHNLLYY